jgi:hypothetical protein
MGEDAYTCDQQYLEERRINRAAFKPGIGSGGMPDAEPDRYRPRAKNP